MLVISNYSGFYRYRMRDILLVTGCHEKTPLVEFQYRADVTVSLMGEKTAELALRTAAVQCARECDFLLVDRSVYPDQDDMRYVFVMENDRVPEDLTEDEINCSLERHLAKANPSYGDKVKEGLIQPVTILFSQPETYVLYKDMMLMRGNSISQLKPVTAITDEDQKNFFFKLVDDFAEIKAQCDGSPYRHRRLGWWHLELQNVPESRTGTAIGPCQGVAVYNSDGVTCYHLVVDDTRQLFASRA